MENKKNINTNNTNINNNTAAKSKLPLALIGLALLATIAGGWWLLSSSKSQTAQSNTAKSNASNANAAKKPAVDETAALKIYENAPSGATPPNLQGSPTAAVTIEEFADFQCPTCATVHTKMKEIIAPYGNRIKFIYRSYPLIQIHKNAYEAAVAAEAAGLQGKYWQMQDQLFVNQPSWANSQNARQTFEGYASKIGLDMAKYQSDVVGLPAKQRVDADMRRGQSLKISGTPTIYINGKTVDFSQFDVQPMRQLIDAELQKAASGGGAATSQPQTNSVANQTQTINSANQTAPNVNAAKSGSNIKEGK
ncbi:MAG: thioredoxin domain-containing protein [Acidobacteria bacterium]|jgi:protein-disulfide isomerase|nr:thioredoxin domain-containing protein [Acidobacteriota bacterium]